MKTKPIKIESKYPDLARILVVGIYRDLTYWQSVDKRKVDRRMPPPQRLRWVAAQDGFSYYSAQDYAGEDLSAGDRKKFSVALKDLENQGIVEIVADTRNRARFVGLTDEGLALAGRLVAEEPKPEAEDHA